MSLAAHSRSKNVGYKDQIAIDPSVRFGKPLIKGRTGNTRNEDLAQLLANKFESKKLLSPTIRKYP